MTTPPPHVQSDSLAREREVLRPASDLVNSRGAVKTPPAAGTALPLEPAIVVLRPGSILNDSDGGRAGAKTNNVIIFCTVHFD